MAPFKHDSTITQRAANALAIFPLTAEEQLWLEKNDKVIVYLIINDSLASSSH